MWIFCKECSLLISQQCIPNELEIHFPAPEMCEFQEKVLFGKRKHGNQGKVEVNHVDH